MKVCIVGVPRTRRPPRCELVARRSMLVVGAGRKPVLVVRGRCRTMGLLYSPAVPGARRPVVDLGVAGRG
jgi:hypothetical protein